MNQKYYATPEMVKDFLRQLSGSREDLPEFPEALRMMEKRGLLSKEPLHKPELSGQMPKEAFMEAFDRQPFEVGWVTGVLEKEHEENRQIALPDSVDVTCAQHIHTYGFTRQTLTNVFSFTYIFQGVCTVSFEDTRIRLTQGDIFISSPGFEHFIHTTPETFAIIVVVRAAAFEIMFQDFLSSDLILSEFFRRYVIEKTAGNYCAIHGGPEDDELRFYVQSLAAECMDKHAYYANSCAVSLLKLLLARAFRKYHDHIDFYQQHFAPTHPDADTIYQFIQMNFQDITLEKIAEQFHFNSAYVSRYIHAHFHKTFSQIVADLRISRAKEYLRKTGKSISEIASLSGFESLNHFSKTFRKYTGQSPSEFRKG